MASHEGKLSIAVVGAGIAGITAAYLLGKRHHVTLIERNDSIGGHTSTVVVSDDVEPLSVDIGFIVCNPQTYPMFYRLLDEWGVERRDSDMSFGFYCEDSGLGYVGPSIREFLRKPSNLLNRRLLGMIREQRRFGRQAERDLRDGALLGLTLGEYVRRIRLSEFFVQHYLVPLAASVWSSPAGEMMDFPALTFIQFFNNHGMLDLRHRPNWQTIVGGSHAYLKAFRGVFSGCIMTSSPVRGITRREREVSVQIEGRPNPLTFDHVVLAAHANESHSMMTDPSKEEGETLSAWRYHQNSVDLHTDESLLPADRRLWASWNYIRRANGETRDRVSITYHMNRLQGLRTKRQYLVTLNAREKIDPDKLIYSVEFSHPGYNQSSIVAQERLRKINGDRRTYFAGAHLRYGFHEDGVASAVEVTRHFGIAI